jgi:hypothetical protein
MHHDTALLATIAVGPFTPGFVADSGLASELAELGVILLMFGVGLHFCGLGFASEQVESSVQSMRVMPATAHATPPRPERVG